jgi:hypothetical protein
MGLKTELKNGAPTEILVLKKTFANNGYIVPTKIVKLIESIKILFKEIAPSLEINFISLFKEKT